MYYFGVATLKVLKKRPFLTLQPIQSYVSNLSKQTLDRNIKYVQGEKPACLLVNKPQFRKLECISEGDTYYEVELAKDKIKIDLPHSTGLHNSTVRKT